MSISEDIVKSIQTKNLEKFKELINHPALLVNEIFIDGLIHYLIQYSQHLKIEFFVAVLEHPNIDVNRLSRDGYPPILCLELPRQSDILQLLLKDVRTNIHLDLANGNTLIQEAAKTSPFIFDNIYDIPVQELPLDFAMDTNMESFRVMLRHFKGTDVWYFGPIIHAFDTKNIEAFNLLLEKGFDINSYHDNDDTLAESIILGDNREFLTTLVKYLHLVREKEKLLLLAITTNKMDIVDSLIRVGCSLSDRDFSKLIMNESAMLRIISVPAIIKPIKEIFATNNITLIRAMLNEPSINFKAVNWNRTLNAVNVDILEEVLETVLRSRILDVQELNIILISHIGYNFTRLVKAGKIEIIDRILTEYPKLSIDPFDFAPMSELIVGKHFGIVFKLIQTYKIVINYDQMYSLIENRQKIILEVILNTYTIDDLYTIHDNGENLLILLELFRDDRVIIQKILDSIFSQAKNIEYNVMDTLIQNPDMFLHFLEEYNIDINIFSRHYDNVDDRIDFNPLIEMFNTYSLEHSKRLFDIIKLAEEYKYDLVAIAVSGESQILFDLIMLDPSICENPRCRNNFGIYIEQHTDFTTANLDNILRLPNIEINIDVFQTIIIIYMDYNELYRRTRIMDKILSHISFNPNEIIDFKDNDVTILYYVIDELLQHEPRIQSDDTEEFLRIARLILRHPLTDVNIGDITPASYLVSELDEFIPNKNYSRMGNYDARCILLSEILAHRSFDINRNYNIILSAIKGEFLELFTILISNPRLDVNNAYVLHVACLAKSTICIEILLTLRRLDVNHIDDDNGFTPLQHCIAANFTEGALLLVNDPRIDLTILDSKGRTYIRLANKAGMQLLADRLEELGQRDLKKERVDREVAEYDARMVLLGRRKEGRIREALNNFDLILKERETEVSEEDEEGQLTPYNLSICPFCLTYLEKEQPYECVYLAGHVCPLEIQNEELKRLYFGENWQTTAFEVCCTCGRPCSHHGHYEPVAIGSGQTSTLLPNGALANHWRCDEHNGGGGKLEMTVRLTGILSELKARVDRDERLVYGPELIRELTAIANSSLFDAAIRDRAEGILTRKKWNVNSKIPKYARFNAPNVNTSAPLVAEEREAIEHISNIDREDKLACMICLDDEVNDVFKPHAGDAGYICGDCLKGQVCASPYASVTCELGCNPKKQIHKEDVDALMGGNFCQ
jgi:ankyrin repeat protein